MDGTAHRHRLPYIANLSESASADDRDIHQRVLTRRGGDLLELDRMLLHSPPVAGGWNEFLGAIRTGTTLADDVRELIICKVAACNKAQYEWEQHAPLLEKVLEGQHPVGVIMDFMEALRDGGAPLSGRFQWAERYEALLTYVDRLTCDAVMTDEVFKALRDELDEGPEGDRTMVEITATCAAYNCVSRFLNALNVGDAYWRE